MGEKLILLWGICFANDVLIKAVNLGLWVHFCVHVCILVRSVFLYNPIQLSILVLFNIWTILRCLNVKSQKHLELLSFQAKL